MPKRYHHQGPKYIKNEAKFDGNTTNANDYTNKGLLERYHHQAPKYIKNEAKFDGTTTNGNDFTNKKLPEKYRHQGAKYVKNGINFEGSTTYHDDFIGFGKVDRMPDFKPKVIFFKTKDERFDLPEPKP